MIELFDAVKQQKTGQLSKMTDWLTEWMNEWMNEIYKDNLMTKWSKCNSNSIVVVNYNINNKNNYNNTNKVIIVMKVEQ